MSEKKCKKSCSTKDETQLGTTCFYEHETLGVCCQNTACRQWTDHEQSYNCVLIAAKSGQKTLQEIGNIFGVTRMRICQIEKATLAKLKKRQKRYM